MTTEQTDNYLLKLLTEARTVAVVGISPRPNRPSHAVAAYLRDVGYRIYPVNPAIESWNGIAAYDTVSDIPEPSILSTYSDGLSRSGPSSRTQSRRGRAPCGCSTAS